MSTTILFNELDSLLEERFDISKEYLKEISFLTSENYISICCQFDEIEKKEGSYLFLPFFYFELEYKDIGCVLDALFTSSINNVNRKMKELNNILQKYLSKRKNFEEYVEINCKNIEDFLKEIKPILKKIDNSLDTMIKDFNSIKKYKITIIDNSLINKEHSNNGRSQVILFKIKEQLYKISILSESYDFQSYAGLYIKDQNGWTLLIKKNPKRDYDIKISTTDFNIYNSFNSIIRDFLQKTFKI